MAIVVGDIKILASQVMDDVDQGGGAPTGNAILDGTSNSVFNDISEADRAGGRVSLRKVHASVQSDDTDTYLGANVIVADPMADPLVSVTIFSTRSTFDRRTDASDRVEAYLYKSGKLDGFLLENHITGQRSIQVFQRLTAEIPTVGQTLCLTMNEGLGNEFEQYVRVTKVTQVTRVFSESSGGSVIDYSAAVTTLELSDALRFDFPGSGPNRLYKADLGKTLLRDTMVADAAQYYGVSPLIEPISIGDLTATVESVFSKVVPSAQTETSLTDMLVGAMQETYVAASQNVVTYSKNMTWSAGSSIILGSGVYPGSASVAVNSVAVISDSGGLLYAGTDRVGVIDYTTGTMTLDSGASPYSGNISVSFKVGVSPVKSSDSLGIPVTSGNRGYNYSQTLVPAPAPRTLKVSYMAQGKWYDLRDDGSGAIRGSNVAYGVGSLSYSTGTASVTLGALPDIGSEVIFTWGALTSFTDQTDQAAGLPIIILQMPDTGLTPTGLSISWNDGSAKSANDSATPGILAGDSVGTVDYETGEIRMVLPSMPTANQVFNVTYGFGEVSTLELTGLALDGMNKLTMDLPDGLMPGSVTLNWAAEANTTGVYSGSWDSKGAAGLITTETTSYAKDNGLGVLKTANGTNVGTINYTTGLVELYPNLVKVYPIPVYQNVWQENVMIFRQTRVISSSLQTLFKSGSSVEASYRLAGASSAGSASPTLTSVTIDLSPGLDRTVVPGSVVFVMDGRTYYDVLGVMYYGIDISNGSGIPAGTVNYTTGVVSLTSWVPGGTGVVTKKSFLTSVAKLSCTHATFRVPVAPVRPQSLQILASPTDGGLINVTADADGMIYNSRVLGSVDYSTGVVYLRFGALVAAAGNETEPWYEAGAVVGGQIFKPDPVFLDTLKYNAVAYSYLPLDASLIGIDPVRLPQDGRVPIFRQGGFAVIGHTGVVAPFVVANDQVVSCGRVRLSRVRVVGANGIVINSGYSADLDMGVVTFTNVSGYSQPVTIEHRIEDMVQVSDVQISGQLGFSRQVTHDYPVPGSFISSALMAGDLHARVAELFDQSTWTSVWSDAVIGSASTASYNDIVYPLEVTNRGAISERWALVFTNTTSFNVIGEHVGVIGTGNTTTDLAPINLATGQPYFTLSALGWGSGWSAGNVLRFNTVGSEFPVWVIRTVQQGIETVTNDSFTLLVRGDVDHP